MKQIKQYTNIEDANMDRQVLTNWGQFKVVLIASDGRIISLNTVKDESLNKNLTYTLWSEDGDIGGATSYLDRISRKQKRQKFLIKFIMPTLFFIATISSNSRLSTAIKKNLNILNVNVNYTFGLIYLLYTLIELNIFWQKWNRIKIVGHESIEIKFQFKNELSYLIFKLVTTLVLLVISYIVISN